MDKRSSKIREIIYPFGCSVTQRVKQVKQPRGGYLSPRVFDTYSLGSGLEDLNPKENVHGALVGLTVDYLTRFMTGTPVDEAFRISLMGSEIIGMFDKASNLVEGIKGLDNDSIINAVKLTGFDVVRRVGIMGYKPVEDIQPDIPTIENIKTMVGRTLVFLEQYGPKVLDGFTFEGAYTDIIVSGDGDFITSDTLWDLKVSKQRILKEHTLQLLVYWRMGLRSIHTEFKSIQYLGIFNARKNEVYRISVDKIPAEVIHEIDTGVIGYMD